MRARTKGIILLAVILSCIILGYFAGSDFLALGGVAGILGAFIFGRDYDRRGDNRGIDGKFEDTRNANRREGELNRNERETLDREGKRLGDEREELGREKQYLDVEKTNTRRERELLEELQKRHPKG